MVVKKAEDTGKLVLVSPDILQKLEETIELATTLDIETLKYSRSFVGGIDQTKSEFLLQDSNIPPLPFDVICISRIPQFLTRLSLMRVLPKFNVFALVQEDDSVSFLLFKAGRTELQFQCPGPDQVRVPKACPEPPYYQVPINGTLVNILAKAYKAMDAENVQITGEVGEENSGHNRFVVFSMKDISNDPFRHAVKIPYNDDKIFKGQFYYPLKIIVPILKKAFSVGTSSFFIGQQRGFLSTRIGDFIVHIGARSVKGVGNYDT